jgi:hypothetical protein
MTIRIAEVDDIKLEKDIRGGTSSRKQNKTNSTTTIEEAVDEASLFLSDILNTAGEEVDATQTSKSIRTETKEAVGVLMITEAQGIFIYLLNL